MAKKEKNQTGKVTIVDYSEEMKQSYIDYAMSVITDRALPDVRDGLKPVHRRIIYAMYNKNMYYNKSYNKCAEIVGDVLGFYHPHGDSSVFEALVRLTQDFSLRHPLIDGHGNFGSIDGDVPAAYRYVEARLHEISNEFINNIEYYTVKMKLSFNEKKNEPEVLPCTLPSLLINGVTGIAVGMMTNIPTHNLKNSIDTMIYLIDNPTATTKDLLNILKGPDFPTGGVICNKNDLLDMYESGIGNITVRGKHHVEESGGKKHIVITEIPFTLSGKKESFVESIIKLAQSKKELQIVSVRDESSKEGIRIVISVKKEIDENILINYLYKFTPYEDTFKFSFLCLDNGQPSIMSLSKYANCFVEFQKEIYKNKYNFLINKNKIQIEKLEGLIIAYDFIDQIIAITRNAKNTVDMKLALMTGNTSNIPDISEKFRKVISKFSFTEIQSSIILETQLQHISKLKTSELQNNVNKLTKENKNYESILKNDKTLLNDIKLNLEKLKTKYGDSRRTQIVSSKNEFSKIEEYYDVIIDENNYAKRIKLNLGTEGYKDDDKIVSLVSNGGIYLTSLKNIPIFNTKDKGIALENFTNGEDVLLSFVLTSDKKILLIDSENYAKIINTSELICSRKYLKGYLKDSCIVLATFIDKEKTLSFTVNSKNKSLKIKDIPEMNRVNKGKKIVQGKVTINDFKIE